MTNRLKEREALGRCFFEWLEERNYLSPISGPVDVLPEIAPAPAVTLFREKYNKIRNDHETLREFAAIVLECEPDQVTPRMMQDHMMHLEDMRAREAAKYLGQAKMWENRYKDALEFLKKWIPKSKLEDVLAEFSGETRMDRLKEILEKNNALKNNPPNPHPCLCADVRYLLTVIDDLAEGLRKMAKTNSPDDLLYENMARELLKTLEV